MTAIARKFLHLDMLSAKWAVRCFVLLSAANMFISLNHLYAYMPYPRGAIKAAVFTVSAHLGLGLATLQWKGHWRILGVLLLIPSIVGLFYFNWYQNTVTIVIWFAFSAWLIKKVLRGW